MDECFHLSYPHIRERLLTIAEKIDTDNYQVYIKSNEVCGSFAAACQVLTLDGDKPQVNCSKISNESINSLILFRILCRLSKMPTKHC